MARKTPPPRNSLTPFYVVLGIVALAGVMFLVYQLRGSGGATGATAPVPVQIDAAELSRVQGVSIGSDDAPVVMYEFADFECPGCGHFAAFMTPLIKERLVQPGLVRYVYYDFPLPMHRHAFLAARAGRCANEQGKFWPMHDLLYARRPEWATEADATDAFIEIAREAGVEARAFEACLRSDRFAEEVSRSLKLGESLGVDRTPTLIVNGKRLPDLPESFSDLERIVRAEAGSAGAAGAPADTAASTGGDTAGPPRAPAS